MLASERSTDLASGNDHQAREDLANLLRFAADMVTVRDRAVFDIAEYPVHLLEKDFLGGDGGLLPGIAFGPSEDAWLSLQRLNESPPPPPPPDLARWLREDARPEPGKPPEFRVEVVVEVPPEEATDLVEAGLTSLDEIAPAPPKLGQLERWRVPLRPLELPDVVASLAAYVTGPWRVWEAEETPRRASVRLYQTLYKARAELAATGGDSALELIVGIGLARWTQAGRRINVPLIEQAVEIALDESDGTLAVLPRNVPPAARLSAFQELDLPDVAALLRDTTDDLKRVADDADVAFSPFNEPSFRPVLEKCAARLDASGTVLSADQNLGPPTETLRISPTFCLIVRRRREDILAADLRRLASGVSEGTEPLAECVRRFVVPPPDTLPTNAASDSDGSGPGHGSDPSVAEWASSTDDPPHSQRDRLFLPLPANDEQKEIVRRLEEDGVHGVVVQGPPGTGKTHTIANVIGHELAMGKRILVSAHTAEALSAIREKLPPVLRNLVVTVIDTDREGARQLERAVSTLADRARTLNPKAARREADELLCAIDEADRRITEIDNEFSSIARANLAKVRWRGKDVTPAEVAAWVAAAGDKYSWFPDTLDLTPEYEPLFSEEDISQARELRSELGGDVVYSSDVLVAEAGELPALSPLIDAHRTLRAAREREEKERAGTLPRADLTALHADELIELSKWLERLAVWRESWVAYPWLRASWQTLVAGNSATGADGSALRALLTEEAELAKRNGALALEASELAEVSEPERLAIALSNLADGHRAFGFFRGYLHNALTDAIASARVSGRSPATSAQWRKLAALHTWRGDVQAFSARWMALASTYDLPSLPTDHQALWDTIGRLGGAISGMLALGACAPKSIERLQVTFPYGIDAQKVVFDIDVSVAAAALHANFVSAKIGGAERLRGELLGKAQRLGGDLGEALRQVAEVLGTPGTTDDKLAAAWGAIQKEAHRLVGLSEALRQLSLIADRVHQSGAPCWAGAIMHGPASSGDPLLPKDWHDAWDYARAEMFLSRITDRDHVNELKNLRVELADTRERQLRELVELRTMLGLHSRMTQSVLAALQQYLTARAHMPKTPGAKSAARQRRILRASLRRAEHAIPCWIMPEWRVAEQLPPELGGFDLVIIDEASQSNILALPVVLRGQKVLIVGDDKQVSPDDVGVEQATISRLRTTYLHGQWLAEQIDPATSLYELAGMTYPGKVMVLREHFRCVEPIIRFSQRFYDGHLLPLRIPTASERLDPPLIDVLVEGGRREGDVNRAEAECIVKEIQALIADQVINAKCPRSIGVISLHSNKQAKLIADRLIRTVGPREMDRHRILCGDAATFQGQERDIVFLSMVHDRNTAKKQSVKRFTQRYNVALSRARDRMILVRSVTSSDLKDGDIKLDVLRHFQHPEEGSRAAQSDDVLAACESHFEREVGKRLLVSGYRLRAQVPVGNYRIDFVVEGAEDHRLAVELDGDAFHGPDRWADDMRRQKMLERMGWTFWRCWASEWARDQDAAFADLAATLERMQITPIGAASPRMARLVEFRKFHADATADGRDRIAPTSPLGEAILGCRIEDEVQLVVDSGPQTIVVEEIYQSE